MSREQQSSVFLTGATGFVGSHTARELVKRGITIRALTRRQPAAAPSDPGIEWIVGDLSQPETYRTALTGVSAVIHAAITDTLTADEGLARELALSAAAQQVRRFVHLSSIAVYGNPPSGEITEDTPLLEPRDHYGRAKQRIEASLREASATPELIILRLGCVYGPGGGWWSQGLINLMRRGRFILVNGGSGLANLIHVFDVSNLIGDLVSPNTEACGTFNITDGEPQRWKSFFEALESIIGRKATVAMTEQEARLQAEHSSSASLVQKVLRKLAGRNRIHPLDDLSIEWFASRAIYSTEKARQQLGFTPTYDFERGIATLDRYKLTA